MPSDQPKKRFAIAARSKPKQTGKDLSVKDNAQPRIQPPHMVRTPQPGLAPPGMAGIRPKQPDPRKRLSKRSPANTNKKPFSVERGNLSKEFKPLVAKSQSKDHGHER